MRTKDSKIKLRLTRQLENPTDPYQQITLRKKIFNLTPKPHQRYFEHYLDKLPQSQRNNIGTIDDFHHLQTLAIYLESNQVIAVGDSSI